MTRVNSLIVVTIGLSLGILASPASGDWLDTVFPVKQHDFGTVAVAAKTEFRFPIENMLKEEIHVRSVRTSCGCTTPTIDQEYIAPGATGSIVARFNTNSFRGKRGATITVVIDKPRYSEVRLRVDGYIRRDVVFHPGEVDFGRQEVGAAETRSTTVYYAGRPDWKLEDVVSNRPWLVPSFEQIERGQGKVNYKLTVKLREDAPEGVFQDELVLVTNDRAMPRIPLPVSGEIQSELSVSPRLIALDNIKPGETIEKRLVIRGKQPFQIDSIECEGWQVDFEPPGSAKALHLLPVRFTATATAGPQKSTVVITTSGEESLSANVVLTAMIRER